MKMHCYFLLNIKHRASQLYLGGGSNSSAGTGAHVNIGSSHHITSHQRYWLSGAFVCRDSVTASGFWRCWRPSASLVTVSCFGFRRHSAVRLTVQKPVWRPVFYPSLLFLLMYSGLFWVSTADILGSILLSSIKESCLSVYYSINQSINQSIV